MAPGKAAAAPRRPPASRLGCGGRFPPLGRQLLIRRDAQPPRRAQVRLRGLRLARFEQDTGQQQVRRALVRVQVQRAVQGCDGLRQLCRAQCKRICTGAGS